MLIVVVMLIGDCMDYVPFILDVIAQCAAKTFGKLILPSLITMAALKPRVSVHDSEERAIQKGIIDI